MTGVLFTMKITFSDLAIPKTGAVIAFATEGADLMPSAVALDEATDKSKKTTPRRCDGALFLKAVPCPKTG